MIQRHDLVVRNIGRLATLAGPAPRIGPALSDLQIVEDAAVAVSEGRITFAGPDADLPVGPAARTVDAGGGAVLPGFVDGHTHLVFAGDRDEEIRQRLAGRSYREIAEAGGGVVEGYPQDTQGKKISAKFLYNTTRSLYEQTGFTYVRPKGKNHCVMRRTGSPA